MRVGRTYNLGPARGSSGNRSGERLGQFFCFIFLAAASIFLTYNEWHWKARNDSIALVRSDVISVSDDRVSPSYANDLVHLTSNRLLYQDLRDNEFYIGGPSLKLKRVTEYCQWQQFHEEHEDNHGNKIRTYYYVKSWHYHRINSLFFDQPFHHHNPQRDPTPSREFVAEKATMGEYTLTQPLIDRIFTYSHFDFNQYPNGAELFQAYTQSPAYQVHKFSPVGQGYFYSAHEESNLGFIARLGGMALEGSLDIQLTELFSTCNAGDIRVHFDIISPASLSVIGKQLDATGSLGLFPIEKFHFDIGILYPGKFGADELFDKDIWDYFKEILVFRVIVFIVWPVLFHLAMGYTITWFSFCYFGLAHCLSSWLIVRLADISMVAISFRNNPISSVLLVGVLLFFAATFHSKKNQVVPDFNVPLEK